MIELTTDQVRLVLATARYRKIQHLQFARGALWNEIDALDVELTAEEKEDALNAEKRLIEARHYFAGIREQNRTKTRLEREALVAEWTYARFYKMMQDESWKRGVKLVFNDQTKNLIKAVCFRLSEDPRYESEMGLSFSKGLMIRGTVGLGKSYTIQLVADNPVCPVQFVTMHEITRSIMDTGQFTGLKFASFRYVYLDDVGSEYAKTEKIKYFGTEVNWFATWFEEFYARSKDHISRVIISTNDSFDDLERKYGFRVRDRLAETFDVLDVYGESMRRK